jgi:hypothetical protein
MKKIKKGGLGNDMGKLLERKEKQEQSQTKPTSIDKMLVENIYNNIQAQPRISFWDVESKIILNYLKETEPKFSISKKISTILQEHFQKEYPEIWAEIEKLRKK